MEGGGPENPSDFHPGGCCPRIPSFFTPPAAVPGQGRGLGHFLLLEPLQSLQFRQANVGFDYGCGSTD